MCGAVLQKFKFWLKIEMIVKLTTNNPELDFLNDNYYFNNVTQSTEKSSSSESHSILLSVAFKICSTVATAVDSYLTNR